MKTLYRYVLSDVFQNLLFALLLLNFLVLTVNIIRLAYMGIEFMRLAELALYTIPFSLIYTLPLSVLAGAVFTFSRMSFDHELIAVQASGIPIRRLALPVLGVGAILSRVALWVNETLVPKAYGKLERIEQIITPEDVKRLILKSGRRNFSIPSGLSRIKITVGSVEGDLIRGMVITTDEEQWKAARAHIVTTGHALVFQMEDAFVREYLDLIKEDEPPPEGAPRPPPDPAAAGPDPAVESIRDFYMKTGSMPLDLSGNKNAELLVEELSQDEIQEKIRQYDVRIEGGIRAIRELLERVSIAPHDLERLWQAFPDPADLKAALQRLQERYPFQRRGDGRQVARDNLARRFKTIEDRLRDLLRDRGSAAVKFPLRVNQRIEPLVWGPLKRRLDYLDLSAAERKEAEDLMRRHEEVIAQNLLLETFFHADDLGPNKATRFKLALISYRRSALAAASFAVLWLGIPMGIKLRHPNRLVAFFLSAFPSFIVYFMLTEVGRQLAGRGQLPVSVGAWFANIVFLGVGWFVFRRVC